MGGDAAMTVFGWDASDFDWSRGPVDLTAAARDGIQFFTHKATEGTSVRHARFGEAMRRAKTAGIEFRGAYVVVRTPGNNGHGSVHAQADYFLSYLDQQVPGWRTDPGFFLQVDLEHWPYDKVEPQHGVQACQLLRAATGKWVVLYAPKWSFGDSIPGDDPLWASNYGANRAVAYRQTYPGDSATGWAAYSRRTPVILQFGSNTRIGSQPTCDANAFRGTLDQFRALITGGNDMAAGDADKAFSAPYTGTEPWVSGRSWMAKAVEAPLRGLTAAVAQILAAQGAAQEDIDALLVRPAVTLDADQLQALGVDLAAALVARPDTPLGDADKPAITQAIDGYFRGHFGTGES
jgi:hypothetical protein